MTWPQWVLGVLGVLALWLAWRRWSESPAATTLIARAVVSEEEARSVPYPYVYVNNDGSVRELHAEERKYLETPFDPVDGGRPYVKWRYKSRDGRGELQGYCQRSKVPQHMVPQPAPAEDPSRDMSPNEVTTHQDGSMNVVSAGRGKRGTRWLRILAGLALFPLSLFCVIGSAAFAYFSFFRSEDPVGIRILTGVLCVVSLWVLILSLRLLLDRPAAGGGLMSPLALRAAAVLFFCLPLGGLWTGHYQEEGFLAVLQALLHFGVAATLWKMARDRSSRENGYGGEG